MEWFVIVVIGVIVWISIKSTRGSRKHPGSTVVPQSEAAKITATITTTIARGPSGSRENSPPDVGELIAAGNRTWILNPKSPLPLTLCDADRELAERLRDLLGRAENWSQKIPDISLLLAQHNLRFKEIDTFIAELRPRFETEVARLIASSSEWTEASEKDRQDLRAEFEAKAIESLGVSVGRADFTSLLEGEPANFTEDDDLLRRFGSDSSLYSFYLSMLGRRAPVSTVKADDYSRKAWERLVEKGFARRGKDIPTPLLLQELRLKDINELLAEAVEKPLGRKAKAIEVALNLPDLAARLSDRISYREMFQVIPPSSLDSESLGRSFSYATALATVVQQTYYTAVLTLDAISERKRESGIYDAWEIRNWEDPIPPCAAPLCKKYLRLPAKLPPFHVGCACQLECSFKDGSDE